VSLTCDEPHGLCSEPHDAGPALQAFEVDGLVAVQRNSTQYTVARRVASTTCGSNPSARGFRGFAHAAYFIDTPRDTKTALSSVRDHV